MDKLIHEMAEAAFDNFEFSCEWHKARDAAIERGQELRRNFTNGDVNLAVNIAKMQWNHISKKGS